jgi:hypothetical protein
MRGFSLYAFPEKSGLERILVVPHTFPSVLVFKPDMHIVNTMKTFVAAFFLAILLMGAAFGQAITVTVQEVPAAIEDLAALRDDIAKTPAGGAVVFIIAMQMYAEKNEIGLKAFTLALDSEELMSGDIYKGYAPKRIWDEKWWQLDKYPFLGRIYAKGTKAQDSYALPPGPIDFLITEVRAQPDGTAKIYVATSSGNMPRPVGLRKNDKGLWKVTEASSLFVGPSVLPPEKKQDDL